MNVVDIGRGSTDAVQALSDMFADGWFTDIFISKGDIYSIAPQETRAAAYQEQLNPDDGAKDLFVLYNNGLDFFGWFPVPQEYGKEVEGEIIALGYSMWQLNPPPSPNLFKITLELSSAFRFVIRVQNNWEEPVSWYYNYVTMWTQKNPPVTNQSARSLGGGIRNTHISSTYHANSLRVRR